MKRLYFPRLRAYYRACLRITVCFLKKLYTGRWNPNSEPLYTERTINKTNKQFAENNISNYGLIFNTNSAIEQTEILTEKPYFFLIRCVESDTIVANIVSSKSDKESFGGT